MKRGIITSALCWIVLLALAFLPQASSASVPRHLMKGNSEPGTSLDVLEKKLKAEGWVLVNKPDQREDLEVATLLDPVTRKPLNRPATIRFSWVVAVAAVDIAPDKKHEEVYHLSSSPSQDLFFKGLTGRPIHLQSTIATSPVRPRRTPR